MRGWRCARVSTRAQPRPTGMRSHPSGKAWPRTRHGERVGPHRRRGVGRIELPGMAEQPPCDPRVDAGVKERITQRGTWSPPCACWKICRRRDVAGRPPPTATSRARRRMEDDGPLCPATGTQKARNAHVRPPDSVLSGRSIALRMQLGACWPRDPAARCSRDTRDARPGGPCGAGSGCRPAVMIGRPPIRARVLRARRCPTSTAKVWAPWTAARFSPWEHTNRRYWPPT